MKKETRKQKKAPARVQVFPESNRFWGQLLILSTALVPMLSYVFHSRYLKAKGALDHLRLRLANLADRRRVSAPAYLASAATLVSLALFLSLFTWGTTVSYGGEKLGTVAAADLADEAIGQVESELNSVLGDTYTLDKALVSYSSGFVTRSSVVEPEDIEENLNEELNLVTYGYTMYVDGTPVGTTRTREALDDLLEYLTTSYRNENTISIEFVEDIEIKEGYVSTDSISNLGDIALLLSSTKEGEVVYTVKKGDTWSQIAQDFNMTSKALAELNPGFDINKLQIGDELLISNAVPYLTVKVTQTEYYVSEIPYEIEYVDDASMWEGDTKVISKGAYGQADVVAEVTYVNSEETERNIISQTTISEPTTEIQARGTTPRPSWAPTGTFRWPTNGTITSYYGYRNIFGGTSFHSGIDIANRTGTDIVAADGGIVTYAGWMSGYGYLVIIDHQNGYTTYYGHNSSMLVSVGDKVFKGQHIAEMGATGRVTGTHCHFEVRYNGERQDPMDYLS